MVNRQLSSSSKANTTLNKDQFTMSRLWKESTEKMLKQEIFPIGSLDSLRWQMAETMVLHWADPNEQGRGGGIQKCLELLDRLNAEVVYSCDHTDEEAKLTMDIYILHAVLKTWNRLFKGGKIRVLPSEMLQRIDGYTSRVPWLEPNIATYTMILDAASRCPDPKERIDFSESLLLRLIKEASASRDSRVRPTVVTFSTVINAYARSGNQEAAERAEKLLKLSQSMYEEHGWTDAEPNAVVYTSVVNAWARAGNPNRAQQILKEMYEDSMLNGKAQMRPNLWTFNTVLSAWSKSSEKNAVESMEKLLGTMKDLFEQGILETRPDTVSYNCLLHALARRRRSIPDAPVMAESLVSEMLQLSKEFEDRSIAPNEISYTALFKILNSTKSVDLSKRAEYWVKQMNSKVLGDGFVQDQLKQMGWKGTTK
ncbi:unnamed protein product [Cylindrotheca closterium]|uniref:Pentacotripeptide-repeat region of PRORP domain-containing protein n=1 Tax=Cylindrotheca closterium TaxID=2856 RepID=A0AAD2FXR1_9STRA|nr:unnamed protein product [Cylindrotheca closterium]